MFELNPIIKYPKQNSNYRKYQQEKKRLLEEDEEKVKEKELKEKMKKELSKEDYNRWQANEYYHKNKEKIDKQHKDARLKRLKLQLEEYEELAEDYPPIKKEREKELELLMKYKKDFTNAQWRFVQYWWCTPIWYKREKMYWFTKPIKIIPNPWIEKCITQRVNQQLKIYNFVKPYINEIHLNEFAPKEKQDLFNKLQYTFKPNTKIFELHQTKGISQNVLAMVANAMLIERWIATLPYMGTCILCWDRVYTSMWQVFMVSPYHNNYKYINEDNIDKIHEDTQKFLKKESYWCVMAKGNHCYLLKVPKEFIYNEKWEQQILSYDYYIYPYKAKSHYKVHELDYDLFYKYW